MLNVNPTTRMPQVGRKVRKPQHRFQIEHRPFQVQPFAIAPVLPGETMKNALLQSRVVTDPIRNKLVGWHIEYYLFYVKHRDLVDISATLQDMMLDLTVDVSTTYAEPANVKYNHPGGTINWVRRCTERVVECYFRDDGETALQYAIDGLPAAAINVENWAQSSGLSAVYDTEPPPELTIGTDGKINASEVNTMMQNWEFLRGNNMTDMTYEDYLRSFGISAPKVELHRPELLRYVREWSYPSNTINPTDGSAASAVSWAVSERADKDRLFREPGFVIGLTVARPKVYLKNLDGNGVGMMADALTWLPALMKEDPWTSLKKFAETKGPLAAIVTDAGGYWVDVKDLLLHGDDFVNVARSTAGLSMVSLPSANLANKYYPALSDVEALFVGATADKQKVRQDGILTLDILGNQFDTTQRVLGHSV